jgi:hypothetical protein
MNKVKTKPEKSRKEGVNNSQLQKKTQEQQQRAQQGRRCIQLSPSHTKKLTRSPRRVNLDTHHPTTACPHRRHDANFSAPSTGIQKSIFKTSTIDCPLSTKLSKKRKKSHLQEAGYARAILRPHCIIEEKD